MKKLIMLYLILVVTIFSNVQAQEYFKYYQGKKMYMTYQMTR